MCPISKVLTTHLPPITSSAQSEVRLTAATNAATPRVSSLTAVFEDVIATQRQDISRPFTPSSSKTTSRERRRTRRAAERAQQTTSPSNHNAKSASSSAESYNGSDIDSEGEGDAPAKPTGNSSAFLKLLMTSTTSAAWGMEGLHTEGRWVTAGASERSSVTLDNILKTAQSPPPNTSTPVDRAQGDQWLKQAQQSTVASGKHERSSTAEQPQQSPRGRKTGRRSKRSVVTKVDEAYEKNEARYREMLSKVKVVWRTSAAAYFGGAPWVDNTGNDENVVFFLYRQRGKKESVETKYDDFGKPYTDQFISIDKNSWKYIPSYSLKWDANGHVTGDGFLGFQPTFRAIDVSHATLNITKAAGQMSGLGDFDITIPKHVFTEHFKYKGDVNLLGELIKYNIDMPIWNGSGQAALTASSIREEGEHIKFIFINNFVPNTNSMSHIKFVRRTR